MFYKIGGNMEILDVYDIKGNKLNKTTVRGNLDLKEGEEFIKIEGENEVI